jgi:CubicO group peptidase (beta-lactamase class C family)
MPLTNIDYIPLESPAELEVLLARLRWIYTLFDLDPDLHLSNMKAFDSFMDTAPIRCGDQTTEFSYAPAVLPEEFSIPESKTRFADIDAQSINLNDFLERNNTQGLLVHHQGHVVYERYFGDHNEQIKWMTFSASKLVIGMLVAIAIEEGDIESVDDPVTKYSHELINTAWDGVTIDHCLKMTSGIDWQEEDLDLYRAGSPYAQLMNQVCFGSIEEHIRKYGREFEPGTHIRYSSIDTEMLGTVLTHATGMRISKYLEERIWKPSGMEMDAYWITDSQGRELALSGLCATLRDYARLGLILAHGGKWNGLQIVPTWFVESLSNPDKDIFELPGNNDNPLISWNQTAIPSDPEQNRGDYMGFGTLGQFIYVDPQSETVIAHHGVYPDVNDDYIEAYKHFWAFRTIIEHLDRER